MAPPERRALSGRNEGCLSRLRGIPRLIHEQWTGLALNPGNRCKGGTFVTRVHVGTLRVRTSPHTRRPLPTTAQSSGRTTVGAPVGARYPDRNQLDTHPIPSVRSASLLKVNEILKLAHEAMGIDEYAPGLWPRSASSAGTLTSHPGCECRHKYEPNRALNRQAGLVFAPSAHHGPWYATLRFWRLTRDAGAIGGV